MGGVSNDVVGQIFQYAGYISVTIASIIGVVYMLRPKPDFRELSAQITKNLADLVKANAEAHEQLRVDQALQHSRLDNLTQRVGCIEGNCQSEKALIREVETRLHNRIDAVAVGVTDVAGQLKSQGEMMKVVNGQLKNIVTHLLRKENP